MSEQTRGCGHRHAPQITVGGHPIPPQGIEFELSRLIRFYSQHLPEEEIRAQLPLFRRRAIEQAVGARLLSMEAMQLDFSVTDAEVEEHLETMRRQAGGAEKFNALLKKQGIPLDAYREQVRLGKRTDKLVESVTAGVPDPTEEEIAAHFEAHRTEYRKGERVRAQHILVKPEDDSAEANEAALRKIREIRARVLDGADFSDEAAAHSDCPSGRDGGSLGWFSRGMMVREFDEAAFEMKVGEVSEPVATQFGWHILLKNAEEAAEEADLDLVRDQIRTFLRHARRGEQLAAHVAELWAKVEILVDGEPLPPPGAEG
ncbi:MAG: peptidylprolyl isomerase [Kiritimatiellia bacterium]